MTAPRPREQADPPSPPDRLPPRRGGRPSYKTESAAARPAGFARLVGARRRFLRSARTLPATALLALSGLLALPATAEAQTADICDRTKKVYEFILDQLSGVDDCATVTVADLEGLTDLDMRNQDISSLMSGDFAGLTSVTSLNLSGNSFITLPARVFSGLTALRTFILNGTQLRSLPAGVFSGLTALRNLSLDSGGLTELDAGVFSGLTALNSLDLNSNALSSLPGTVFFGLTALANLNLNNNALGSLPAGVFSGLTSLGILNLDRNSLTKLPDGLFAGLTALRSLHLNDNALRSLPGALFSDTTSLDALNLHNNKLSGLPAGVFAGLTGLDRLSLEGNLSDPLRLRPPRPRHRKGLRRPHRRQHRARSGHLGRTVRSRHSRCGLRVGRSGPKLHVTSGVTIRDECPEESKANTRQGAPASR